MSNPEQGQSKRPYEAPRVTPREQLPKVTAIVKKVASPAKEKPCWVARAVYGEENPRWILFRGWLIEDAPRWLRGLYLRHGQAFAPVVERHRWLARGLRPLMDRAIDGKYRR